MNQHAKFLQFKSLNLLGKHSTIELCIQSLTGDRKMEIPKMMDLFFSLGDVSSHHHCGTPDLPARKTPQQDPSATRLLGEHWLRRQKTPSPRTGAVYIGLGVTCPHLIGCAFSTSFTCLGPGSDSAKNSMAHAHIGCLPIFMGVGLLKLAPFCNGVCGFPHLL